MKQGIHPEYKPTTIVCSCGNRIETRSTQEEIHVEICSVCHPFYTGRQKLVDTAGRVERFKRKYGDVGGGAADGDEADREEESAAAGEAEGADSDGRPEERAAAPRAVGAPAAASEEDSAAEDDAAAEEEAGEDRED